MGIKAVDKAYAAAENVILALEDNKDFTRYHGFSALETMRDEHLETMARAIFESMKGRGMNEEESERLNCPY